jgi:hypothetical protein
VPALTAVTRPVPRSTVATVGQAMLHVPLGVPCVSVFVWPIHSGMLPTIAVGVGVTVITVVVLQPALSE